MTSRYDAFDRIVADVDFVAWVKEYAFDTILEIGSGRGVDIRELATPQSGTNAMAAGKQAKTFVALDRSEEISKWFAAEAIPPPPNGECIPIPPATMQAEGDAAGDSCDYSFSARVISVAHTLPAPLPFASGAFDVVFSRLALHYFDEEALRQAVYPEISRVLRPSGVLVFVVKTAVETTPSDIAHVRAVEKKLLSAASVRRLLGECGFKVEKSECVAEVAKGLGTGRINLQKFTAFPGDPWAFHVRMA